MKSSFANAFRGIAACLKAERNFRFHLAVAFYVLVAAAVTEATGTEWLFILGCIGAVTGAELFNTSIETLCDTLHPDKSYGIARVKDMAAGGVLMCAAASAVIGGIIFFNAEKVSSLAKFASAHVALAVLILATVPAAVFLVFRRYENDQKNSYDYNRRTSQRR
jgi:diacylglycerol kinase